MAVPSYVIGIIEVQFMAYLQLIRQRFGLMNTVLINFQEFMNNNEPKFSLSLNEFVKCSNSSNRIKNRFFHKNNANDIISHKNSKNHHMRLQSTFITIMNEKTLNSYQIFPRNIDCIPNKWINATMQQQHRTNDYTECITQIHKIYMKTEQATILFKTAFSIHILVILIMKFTTLTSLLYFCCMIIIKYV